MAYEPTEWVCGDTVTADKLNKLERGIQEIMSDYVPTEWQCGDVITADKLNKLEQAVADFECGSSDFSTATVSIVNTNGNANLDFYGIVDNSYAQALLKSDGDYLVGYSWIGETNTTAEFLMVQNSFMIAVPMVEPTITGSATKEYLSEYSEWDVTITGDCTITIS